MLIGDLATPALVVDADAFEHNLAAMATAPPTALARRQVAAGHGNFACATIREMEGMAAAGLGEDLLLANEVFDATRLQVLDAGVRLGVDSETTIETSRTAW